MTTNVKFSVAAIQDGFVDVFVDVVDYHSGEDVVVESVKVEAGIDYLRYLTTTRKLVVREQLVAK